MSDCILGLDISTSVIGISCVTDSGVIMITDSLVLPTPKYPTIWEKARVYEDFLCSKHTDFADNGLKIKSVFVEEAFKSFSQGRSSSDTLSLLQQFNGIVCWITSKRFHVDPQRLNVAHARKLVGYKKKYFSTRYPEEKEKQLVFRWGLSVWQDDLTWGKQASQILAENESAGDASSHKGIKKNWYDEMDSCVIAMAGVKSGIS